MTLHSTTQHTMKNAPHYQLKALCQVVDIHKEAQTVQFVSHPPKSPPDFVFVIGVTTPDFDKFKPGEVYNINFEKA